VRRAVLADAGPLYAAADASDAHHRQALQQLEKLTRDRREVVVPYPTFLEAYSLVLFRMGTNAAFKWLTYMAEASLVNPTPEDYREAVARVRAMPDQRITLFDAVAAVMAARLKLEVWTYDYHFDLMRVSVWRS
jgi:predicted nucleic acid-binding protein